MNQVTAHRADYLLSALTILSVLPYETGELAMIIPPAWKPYVAAASVIARLVLGEVKMRQAQQSKPES